MIKPRPKHLRKIKVGNRITEAICPPKTPLTKFQIKCNALCNRLQAGGQAHDVFLEIAKATNVGYASPKDMVILVMDLAQRCDTTIKTLQINYDAGHLCYQVEMQYTDMAQPAVYGHFRPKKYAVKTSTSLALAAILAYIEVSKQTGRFI